jgi:outer membrane biosynthesis protein TonB
MRTAIVLFLSLAIHVGFVAAGLIYFPQRLEQYTTSQIVPLELIDEIAPETNLPEEEVEEIPVEEEAPAPPPEDTPPEIDLDAAPETEAEPDPAPVETPAATPEPEAPPQQDMAPAPAPSRSTDSLDSLLGDLASVVDEERAAAPSRNQTRGAQSSEAIGVTLADSIRSQAQRCWRSSVDAPDPERLIVVVRVRLNRDGSLDGRPEPLNRQAIDLAGDRFWNVARDRALAAIIDCAPYRLPAEYYSEWRRIDVTFRQET